MAGLLLVSNAIPNMVESALPTNQIQSNKLPNKSIKYPENLISNKQIQNLGFEITFDIFGTGYDAMEDSWLGSWPPFLTTYPVLKRCQRSGT
jgi:hypothetical protein